MAVNDVTNLANFGLPQFDSSNFDSFNKSGFDTPVSGQDGGFLSSLFDSNTLSGLGSIAGGIGGIMGAMNASDQLGLAEDQFEFQMDFANRNMANQAQLINNKVVGDEQRYLQDLKGNDDNQAGYERNQSQGTRNAQGKTVDGTPIG